MFPNSVFTSIVIENPSRMSHRRIRETIGIRYDDVKVLNKIVADIKKMLVKHKDIDEKQTTMVNFDKFSSSSVDIFIYAFTHTKVWSEYHDIKQDVLLKICDIISSHKAENCLPNKGS